MDASFFIGPVLVEPRRHSVAGPDGPLAVEPKVMAVLVCLARQPGEVVTREALLAEVWAGTVVTDHVLTRAVSELRRLLGDRGHPPSVIETIPKVGYRLAAPVRPAGYGGDSLDAPGVLHVAAVPAPPALPASSSSPPAARTLRRWAWAAAGVASLAAAVALAALRQPAPPATATRPLTTLQGLELSPAFSPDGSQVAFVWRPEGGEDADLYVKTLEAETPLRLTSMPGAEQSPAWSPDGQRLAFARRDAGACTLVVVPALGGDETTLGSCDTSAGGLDWSPDGRWLAFSEGPPGARRLSALDLATGARRPLAPPAPGATDDLPAFAPDGRRVAFVRARGTGMADLYVADFDAAAGAPTAPRRLTHDQAPLGGHAWTPDGRRLVFSSARDGLYRMWSVGAGGGRAVPYAPVSAWDPGGPAFARQGGRMAYVEWFYRVNIWRTPGPRAAPGAADGRVAGSTRSDYHPALSPQGDRLAFVSIRSGSAEVWVSRADGGDPVRLTATGSAATAAPRWSPDGRRLAFATRTGGTSAVFVVDAVGGRPVRLTAPGVEASRPAWSADGRTVYFAATREGRSEIWKVPSGGGTAVPVVVGVEAGEGPDGAALFVTRVDTTGIWRFDPRTGASERVVDAHAFAGHTPWHAARSGLYYLRVEDGAPAVYHYAYATGRSTRAAALPATALTPEIGFAVSPDESWIYYARRDRFESDLMLVAPSGDD